MARKYSKGKKPTETMRQRQQRLLREQRARKAAAKAAKSTGTKSLPSRGQTGGNSLKSRAQRKGTAKRIAGQQQRVISEAMRKTLKQRQALDKKEAAAKGTKGTKVQTGTRTKGGPLKRQGPSSPTRSRKGAATSTRVEKVKVRVEPQKALKAGSQKALPPAKNSLPAGKKGGSLASTKGPRRRNINGNPSKGTQMGTKGSAKAQLRLPKGSIRSAGAASKALSTTGKVAGRIALPLAAYSEGKGLYDSLKRGEGYARLPGMIGKALKGNGKNKKTTGAKTNSRGRRVGTVPVSKTKPAGKVPAKRGMSNIPPSEGTGKGSPNDKPTTRRNVTTTRTAPQKSRKTAPKTAKQRAYAADSRNKEYDRLRKAGKIKEATALGKKINEDKFGKKKKKNPNKSIRKAAQNTYNRGSA